MEWTMRVSSSTPLSTFNSLALQYQDDAYTLAYYLLGDEARAAEATQAAFKRIYQKNGKHAGQFRVEVLRWVLENCRSLIGAPASPNKREAVAQRLLLLPAEERSAVVLVDLLQLTYDEAAAVLNSSHKKVGQLVAQARVDLIHQAATVH